MDGRIAADSVLEKELAAVITGLEDDLQQKMRQGADAAAEYIKSPDLTEADFGQIQGVEYPFSRRSGP